MCGIMRMARVGGHYPSGFKEGDTYGTVTHSSRTREQASRVVLRMVACWCSHVHHSPVERRGGARAWCFLCGAGAPLRVEQDGPVRRICPGAPGGDRDGSRGGILYRPVWLPEDGACRVFHPGAGIPHVQLHQRHCQLLPGVHGDRRWHGTGRLPADDSRGEQLVRAAAEYGHRLGRHGQLYGGDPGASPGSGNRPFGMANDSIRSRCDFPDPGLSPHAADTKSAGRIRSDAGRRCHCLEVPSGRVEGPSRRIRRW